MTCIDTEVINMTNLLDMDFKAAIIFMFRFKGKYSKHNKITGKCKREFQKRVPQ